MDKVRPQRHPRNEFRKQTFAECRLSFAKIRQMYLYVKLFIKKINVATRNPEKTNCHPKKIRMATCLYVLSHCFCISYNGQCIMRMDIIISSP